MFHFRGSDLENQSVTCFRKMEMDGFGRSRDSRMVKMKREDFKNQLLSEMDGFDSTKL